MDALSFWEFWSLLTPFQYQLLPLFCFFQVSSQPPTQQFMSKWIITYLFPSEYMCTQFDFSKGTLSNRLPNNVMSDTFGLFMLISSFFKASCCDLLSLIWIVRLSLIVVAGYTRRKYFLDIETLWEIIWTSRYLRHINSTRGSHLVLTWRICSPFSILSRSIVIVVRTCLTPKAVIYLLILILLWHYVWTDFMYLFIALWHFAKTIKTEWVLFLKIPHLL